MNLALIDPFALAQDYPDILTGTLSKTISTYYLFVGWLSSNFTSLFFFFLKGAAMRHVCGSIAKEIF